ncbi:hypothetical protein FNV43_RR00037 [Rhamnella rubrinervis]|uniref:Uncharacterized protein n=1 Tax=Rhamnella rubrinervis TaxID=2594499 RepID=A0A8K0HMC2_9ROSA|nr:hypothetical protein FNV43_RR00037 [Rhamnella rubrinervis]
MVISPDLLPPGLSNLTLGVLIGVSTSGLFVCLGVSPKRKNMAGLGAGTRDFHRTILGGDWGVDCIGKIHTELGRQGQGGGTSWTVKVRRGRTFIPNELTWKSQVNCIGDPHRGSARMNMRLPGELSLPGSEKARFVHFTCQSGKNQLETCLKSGRLGFQALDLIDKVKPSVYIPLHDSRESARPRPRTA